MKKTKKAFTLIELLVVIAIIGILASVVLASLNTARSKGTDAAVKANLDNMRAEAAIYYDGNGAQTYGTAAFTTIPNTGATACSTVTTTLYGDVTFCNGMQAAASASGTSAYLNVLAGATPSWVAGAATKSVTGWWCVDSSGSSKQEISTISTTTMPTTIAVCP